MKTSEVASDLPTAGIYQFGDFRLNAAESLLQRLDGSPVPLTPKVFDTLLFLVHHAGAVLTKQRLMEAIWPDSIVEENNLSQNISTLRRVFRDTAEADRFILTVPGRGYRFIPAVRRCDALGAEAPSVEPAGEQREALPSSTLLKGEEVAGPVLSDEKNASRFPRAVVAGIGAAFLLALIAVLLWHSFPREPAVPAFSREKGIAVLPFENLSADNADAFFADGVQDDILTSVGKIKDLKVIARTSVMDYRGTRRAGKVREIGEALGVSHVLEGSVRRQADRVVVNVALIDTRDERRVWSERYERTLTDTLSLQGELAVEIAGALHAKLTPAEALMAAAKPTQNPEAYLLYLRGREIEIPANTTEQLQGAIQRYQQAVDLDPGFALARARLSICASQLFNFGASQQWKAKARSEAEEALRLRPDLGEARLALTRSYLWGDRNYDRALAELTRTRELLPNSAEVALTAAFIYKWQNRYRDRIAALQRAEALDPRNRRVLGSLTSTLRWVRDWREAMLTFDRYAAVAPAQPGTSFRWLRASDEFRLTGEITGLKKAIAEDAGAREAVDPALLSVARYETALLERDYVGAAQSLSAIPPETFRGATYPMLAHSKVFHEALLAVASSTKPATKQQALEVACRETEAQLAPAVEDAAPEKVHADLALLYALQGRKEEAIGEAFRAVELTPAGMIERNDLSSALAMVYAQTGELEKAVDLLEHLLTVPTELQRGAVYNMTQVDLKWRWLWDPLRTHPRFQKILAGPEPPTNY